MSLRLGLCCLFEEAPIRFRTVTFSNFSKPHLTGGKPLNYLSELIAHNIHTLQQAIRYCACHRIGAFRINSQFFPLATHPQAGYEIEQLPRCEELLEALDQTRQLSQALRVRLSLHPDQFILLNSLSEATVEASCKELHYQDRLASYLSADVITIHAGGGYGDKQSALKRLESNLDRLTPSLREKLTLENDDKLYTPEELLPLCRKQGLPLTYDVHHHRCNPDGLTIEEATRAAYATWNREPLFHISSPIEGWSHPKTARRHHDYIEPSDFPTIWRQIGPLTVDIEAKAKELAVAQLLEALGL